MACSLIITDIMMPYMTGYELCYEIRSISDVPIIMLSAKDEEKDKILGLKLGSDDYLAKPFSLNELSLKVRNMLRRLNKTNINSTNDVLVCQDIVIDKKSRVITIHSIPLKVTVKEYNLLEFLIKNKNKAFSREEILEEVWEYDYYGDTRQVDHIVKRIRKKMFLAQSICKIETLWGFGYKVSD